MSDLALLGGTPVRDHPFPPNLTIGEEEKAAAIRVLDDGNLSAFYASPDDRFFGGRFVRGFEDHTADYFGVGHAVSFNSATSALHAAVYAAGIGPGDEVIVAPYTMTATASAILMQGGIPIFADIDDRTYTITPESVETNISPHTKAIMAVDLFGGPAALDELRTLADRHGLLLIEDAAQAPGGEYRGRKSGTVGDIGVFSLNCHKAVQSGEGGLAVTRDADLAMRMKLIRNHGEVVVGTLPGTEAHVDVLGYNYRLTELQAAIAVEQWKKLDRFNEQRIRLAEILSEELANLEGIWTPHVEQDWKHVFYIYPIRLDPEALGISRARFAEAVNAEGIPLRQGYVKPIYLQPLYQRKRLHGDTSYPFALSDRTDEISYEKGICPTVERMHFHELTTFHEVYHGVSEEDVRDVARAIRKVHAERNTLRRNDGG